MKSLVDEIREAYNRARGTWTGCDWSTEDDYGVDLDGVRSCDLYDRAEEDPDFWADCDLEKASRFLRGVEMHAIDAERLAKEAMEALDSGVRDEACRLASEAASVEREYGDAPTWGRFASLCETWAEGDIGDFERTHDVPKGINWQVPGEYQGQAVEVAFGITDGDDDYIYARHDDRRRVSYYRRQIRDDDDFDFQAAPPDGWEEV